MKTILATLLLSLLAVAGQPAKEPAPKPKFVDYESELNDKLGKGITPEKNANVLLFKVFGPKPEGGKMADGYFKRLGIEEPPEKGDYLVGIGKFLSDHLQLQREEFEDIFNQHGWATKLPWAAKDYPIIGAWIKQNEKPLIVLHEAVNRPQYYNPLVSRKTDDDHGSLIAALLPSVQKCRELASLIVARAMLRLHEGKTEEAWADLMAAHRLARHVAHGGTLIESLVGIAIESIASNADLAFLEHAKLNSKQVQEKLKDLQTLPAFPTIAEKIDLTERYVFLDCLNMVRRGGFATVQGLAGAAGGATNQPTPEELKALEGLDWEPAIKKGHAFYDRLTAALRLPTRAERKRELDKIEAEWKVIKAAAGDKFAQLVPGKDPGPLVVQSISDVLLTLLAPAIQRLNDARDRYEQIHSNLQIAFAMAAYRLDVGRYPTKLDDLAPKYLTKVPGDVFSGKPLIYKPDGKGYLFYSVGANGIDEGGRWYDDDPRGDDPHVRMPLPPLKKE